jgi:hypothetical protein
MWMGPCNLLLCICALVMCMWCIGSILDCMFFFLVPSIRRGVQPLHSRHRDIRWRLCVGSVVGCSGVCGGI